jgi:hypothetical protein
MIFAALVLLAGCSVKAYRSDLPVNLRVATKIDTGSAMKSTVAEFDVHLINSQCVTDHLGRVYLDDPVTRVGIPVDQPLYLDFIFASKTVLSSTISAIRHQTLFTARSGYEYSADVSYIKGIYNVVIREKRRGDAQGTTVPRRPLSSCKPHSRKK